MKNITKFFLSISIAALAVTGCKKEENKIFYEGGTAPVLTTSNTGDMVLDSTNAANVTALVFNWTNPEYKLTTGVNSHDVTYILQMDTTGSNFTNPNIQEVAKSGDLRFAPSVKEFNSYFNKMGLANGMAHNIDFRVKATLSNGTVTDLYSNVISFKVTPYLDVAVSIPAEGTLWVIGDAFASGWSNPIGAPYDVSQQFTRVSQTLYELTVNFVGGGHFKMIQKQGVWNTQYRPKYDSNVPFASGNFEQRDADPGWDGPGTAGTYKITMDFVTGKYKIEKQ